MSRLLAVALFGVFAAPALASPPVGPGHAPKPAHPLHRQDDPTHAPAKPAPETFEPAALPPAPSVFPHIAPYPAGQGDNDGLSTNPADCNRGCVGI